MGSKWHCSVDVTYALSDWTGLQWALGIVQLVAYKAGESILCVRGGYAALHKLQIGGTRVEVVQLDFLLYMSAKFEFGVFLSSDTMLLRYMLSSCVHLRC